MAQALNEFKRVVLISFITLAYGHNLPLSDRESSTGLPSNNETHFKTRLLGRIAPSFSSTILALNVELEVASLLDTNRQRNKQTNKERSKVYFCIYNFFVIS